MNPLDNQELGVQLVRHGVSRWVLLFGRFALKFPSFSSWDQFLQGLRANMQETRFASWKRAVDSHKLCPILFTVPGGWLNIMPRVRMLAPQAWDAFKLEFDKWKVVDDDFHVPVERKRSSFGWLDGRVVAIDYGN